MGGREEGGGIERGREGERRDRGRKGAREGGKEGGREGRREGGQMREGPFNKVWCLNSLPRKCVWNCPKFVDIPTMLAELAP